MPLQQLPVIGLDDVNHRRRHRETTNKILTHQFDDSKVRTAAEITAGVTPVNYAFAPYIVDRYGADSTGTNDSTAAFNTAFAACKQGDGGIVEGLPGATYRIDGQLSIDLNAVGFDGHGCYLNCAGNTTQATWLPTQGNSDVNLRGLLNAAHPLQNFSMIGPGTQNTTAVGLVLKDSALFLIYGVTLRNVGFINWGTDVIFDDGAFMTQFYDCFFAVASTGNIGPATTFSIIQKNGSNTGERQTFIGCTWTNKPMSGVGYISNQSPNADIYCIGCSADANGRVFNVTAGSVYWIGGHIEIFDDSTIIGAVDGANSLLVLKGTQLVMQHNRTSFDIFNSAANVTAGGVYLDDIALEVGNFTMDTYLVGGTGVARIGRIVQNVNGDRPTLSAFCNALAYGDFESASYANDWTLTGGAVRSNVQAHAGTWSLSLPDSGTGPTAKAIFPCSPGQYLQGEVWVLAPAITGTGSTFRVVIAYLDAASASITVSVSFSTTTNIAAWTKVRFPLASGLLPAPKGTRFALLQLDCGGRSAGTPIAYIDDIIVSVTG